MNLAEAFEAIAEGPILGAVIGDDDRRSWGKRDKFPEHGKLLAWSKARPIIDYEYDNGYGGADCHAVYVWTKTQVMFVGEYDGATGIAQVPRNPVPCDPGFSGN